ncbi:MAG: phospholipase [Desulfobulbaceae bacterium]|nr:phospholipase [Desulfobulbaceae bacterium]
MVAKGLRNITLALLALLLSCWVTPAAQDSAQPSLPAAQIQLLTDTDYYPALLSKIRAAAKSIDLVMYLWKITGDGGGKPAELAKGLGEAKHRGVAVRVILENSRYDENLNRANRETAELLRQEGITAFFDSQAVTTHTKLAIIDHRFCLVGSHNLTQSALERNHEISLLLDSPSLAGELGRYMETLLNNR